MYSFPDTTTIRDFEQLFYLKSLILPHGKLTSLLYRGSRDGWKYIDFHSRCDNKGPTVVLWRTDENIVLGGFASVSWDSSSSSKHDSKAFIFNIDKKIVFPVKDASIALKCGAKWGPNFGGDGSNDLGS